jgi:YfiH family protein
MRIDWITPDWPAPAGVRAVSTLRVGGVSAGPFASLNLGDHVGDGPSRVAENRHRLRAALALPADPLWLNQVHGIEVVRADSPDTREADAAWTAARGVVCAVMTADCLPILLCDRQGTRVAAVHAGWRGLANGVVEAAVSVLDAPDPLAWLGPAIGPEAFEVGEEVRQVFIERLGDSSDAFRPANGKWRADLYTLARRVLHRAGVTAVHGGGYCTHSDPARFFSYRRDGQTGRMASLIWLE